MKVIDLLNKIANGEEVPRFKYEGKRYKYNKYHEWFDDLDDNSSCKDYMYLLELNNEIEIIEYTPKEDKKIEKLSTWYSISDTRTDGMSEYLDYNNEHFYNKINEIIDKVNGDLNDKIN